MFRSSSRMVNPGCQEQSREPYLQVGTGSWVHLTECLVMNNGRFDSRLQGSNGRGREEPWTLHISSRQIWGFSCKKQGAHCRGVVQTRRTWFLGGGALLEGDLATNMGGICFFSSVRSGTSFFICVGTWSSDTLGEEKSWVWSQMSLVMCSELERNVFLPKCCPNCVRT